MKTNQKSFLYIASVHALFLIASGCGPQEPAGSVALPPNDSTAVIAIQREDTVLRSQSGLATYYGPGVEGRKTSSGKTFNSRELVAAHPAYPMGTQVRVTNLRNDKAVEVEITDRGPTKKHQKSGVIIDLSAGAAREIDLISQGRGKVRVDVLEWGDEETK